MKKEPFSLAWDRLRTWGKGEKNRLGRKYKSVSEASREVVLGRERVAPPFPLPQATPLLVSLADIFPILSRFLLFLTTAEPVPRLPMPEPANSAHAFSDSLTLTEF